MMNFLLHSGDLRAALQLASATYYIHPPSRKDLFFFGQSHPFILSRAFSSSSSPPPPPHESISAVDSDPAAKPEICTADELHHVRVPGTCWRIALWRYLPPPEAPKRNHPLMLLSGVGTNAIGYDLSPGASFARHMSSHGYDTWVVEMRGAGLSMRETDSEDQTSYKSAISDAESVEENSSSGVVAEKQSDITSGTAPVAETSDVNTGNKENPAFDQSVLATKLSDLFMHLPERLAATVEDFRKQLDLIVIYDWDFDNYLEEDVPTAMEYIKKHTKSEDGKLLAIGHSMGGILLYAMLSKCMFEGRNSGLAAVVTLASSVDYTSSNSTLKLLVPLADPAQAINVPVVPLGPLLAAAYPLVARSQYALSWLNAQVSSLDMMHPELFEKLILKSFCTIPAKVLIQLATAFKDGGLRNRAGDFCYKDHLHKCKVPILALAGNQDVICPPEAVYETVKLFPEQIVTYKVFGKPEGPHYAHYDLVGGCVAVDEAYPCILEFLDRHDKLSSDDDSD